jgi:uncharacterized protein YjbI with pentapeptide repeats
MPLFLTVGNRWPRWTPRLLPVDNASVANPEHVAIINQGLGAWDRWRADNPEQVPDLEFADLSATHLRNANLCEAVLRDANLQEADLGGADLREANLMEADLYWANLQRADLRQADLREADLTNAGLDSADLREANLREANLSWANLQRADLRQADLREADLREANLSGADLSGAKVGWTIFAAADLSVAKGFEMIQHDGPSTIGIDTIYRSGGRISDIFLRGAGVPDNFITYVGSIIGNPIEFYSCFISYSSTDQDFADRSTPICKQRAYGAGLRPKT